MRPGPLRRAVPAALIRPLDIAQDMAAVADLLEEAFGSELDALSRQAIKEMRLIGRWGQRLGRLSHLLLDESIGPGFVWVEGGRLLGNLSLRRAGPPSSGWLIGNVAVRIDQRGRGIARALMEKTLTYIQQHGGGPVSLLVRADNAPAVGLYTRLGFRQTGALAQWWRPRRERPRRTSRPPLPAGLCLRPARAGDQKWLYELVQASQPRELVWADPLHRSDLYAGWEHRLSNWLNGRRQACLVIESSQGLAGAAWAKQSSAEGYVRSWVSTSYRGQVEASLIGATLDALGRPAAFLQCNFPAQETAMYAFLAQFGFLPARILVHMRKT